MADEPAALATALATCSAQAATIDWTDWSSNTAGSLSGGITVAYSGEEIGLITSADYYNPGVSNYNSGGATTCCDTLWFRTTTFADGSTVANTPNTAYNAIKLIGSGVTDTITFSEAVLNPVISIWSLGNANTPAQFVFTSLVPVLIATGTTAINDWQGGDGVLTVSGDTVSGVEGNGTIEFLGTYTSISFTSTTENYYGFTVGIAGPSAVPLPSTWLMLLSGLVGVGFFAYRGTKKNTTALAAA